MSVPLLALRDLHVTYLTGGGPLSGLHALKVEP